MKYDWNDISIVPASLSTISSRKEINSTYEGKLPLFTAPMDKVIDETNLKIFEENNINVCLPRHVKYEKLKNDNYFYSYGLDEIIELLNNKSQLPKKVLIDIAQGHMKKLYDTAKLIKETFGNNIELMVGNIANPDTYREYCEIGVDYIRVGIGNGAGCLTTQQTAIGYPMGSLIRECYEKSLTLKSPSKIVADGGMKDYSDVIKALALGADFVMIGSIFNKALQSCGDTYLFNKIKINQYSKLASFLFDKGFVLTKRYRGMSSKEVQKKWGLKTLKTSEGVVRIRPVEYKLDKWDENFTDYLKSNMSYSGAKDLESYIGKAKYNLITENSFKRFNK